MPYSSRTTYAFTWFQHPEECGPGSPFAPGWFPDGVPVSVSRSLLSQHQPTSCRTPPISYSGFACTRQKIANAQSRCAGFLVLKPLSRIGFPLRLFIFQILRITLRESSKCARDLALAALSYNNRDFHFLADALARRCTLYASAQLTFAHRNELANIVPHPFSDAHLSASACRSFRRLFNPRETPPHYAS